MSSTIETPATPATPAAPQTDLQRLEMAFKASAESEVPVAPSPAAPEAPKAPSEVEGKGTLNSNAQRMRLASIKDAQEKRAWAKQRDELQSQLKEYQEFKTAVERRDAWAILKMAKFEKPEEFTAAMAEKGPITQAEIEARAARKEIEEFKAQQVSFNQQQALDRARNNVQNFLNGDDNYELARAEEGGTDLVMAVADEIVKNHPNPDSLNAWDVVRDAAARVEKHYETKYEKAANLKKVKAKWGAPAPQAAPQAPSANRDTPRTINNRMSAITSPAPELSDDDRLKWVADEMKKLLVR